jgi:hypothetical protein
MRPLLLADRAVRTSPARDDGRVPNRWRVPLDRELRRLQSEWRGALLWALRITVAATASYVVGLLIFPGTQPLLAPLTAMLVVQVTPVSLLASGLDRVVSVVLGVSLAVGFASVVPLEWWSLGLLIFVSVIIGQVLRLQSNLMEVAISGMLVLGVGSLGATAAAGQRIAETLVGAGVGIAANLLFPPRIPTADAGRAIEGLADAVSDVLRRSAQALDQLAPDPPSVAAAAPAWLGEARSITHHDVPRVGASLERAEQGRRLNVRAVATSDVGPGLRHGLEALEHTALSVRSMFRALADATSRGDWLDQNGADDVLRGLAQVFRELADAIDAFGELVRLEAAPARQVGAVDFGALQRSVLALPEARDRLEDFATFDGDPQLAELHAAVLSTVVRVQRELDLEQRVRRQLELRRPRRARPPLLPSTRRRPPVERDIKPDDVTQQLPRIRGTDEP